MFLNLQAEQSINKMTNKDATEVLGLTCVTYEKKSEQEDFSQMNVRLYALFLILLSNTCLNTAKRKQPIHKPHNRKEYKGTGWNMPRLKQSERDIQKAKLEQNKTVVRGA